MPLHGILKTQSPQSHRPAPHEGPKIPAKAVRFVHGDLYVAPESFKTKATAGESRVEAEFKSLLDQIGEACENLGHRAFDLSTISFDREEQMCGHLLRKISLLCDTERLSAPDRRTAEKRQVILRTALRRKMLETKLQAAASRVDQYETDLARLSEKMPNAEAAKASVPIGVDGHAAPQYLQNLEGLTEAAERLQVDVGKLGDTPMTALTALKQVAEEHFQMSGQRVDVSALATKVSRYDMALKLLQDQLAELVGHKDAIPYHESLEAIAKDARGIKASLDALGKISLKRTELLTENGEPNLLHIMNLFKAVDEQCLEFAGNIGLMWRASPRTREAEKSAIRALEKQLTKERALLQGQFYRLTSLARYLKRQDLSTDLSAHPKLFAALKDISLPIAAVEYEAIKMLCVFHADIKNAVFTDEKVTAKTAEKVRALQAYLVRLEPVLANLPKLRTPELGIALARAQQTARAPELCALK